ncbi:MAG: RNA polymerase sigma factor [Deltaproteobacteria bacterium]|nr:RNA polymerase sigma factor [Deltaproteobacteria bacterium]
MPAVVYLVNLAAQSNQWAGDYSVNERGQQNTAEEQRLLRDAFGGDRAAFGKLVIMYQTPVYSICMRYLKGEDARDAAQEVFIKAFVRREQYVSGSSPLPWLLTIARNLCIDRLRKKRVETPIDAAGEPQSAVASAEAQLETRQSLEIVRQQMEKLPAGQREAIVLHHVEGLAYREIAEVLSIPQGTVMTWLHRGRRTIADALKRHEKA